VSYGQYKNRHDSAGNATSYAIRHDDALSKRTGLYAGITRIDNGRAASFTAAPPPVPGSPSRPGTTSTA
jgi:hypothetical protein